MRFENLSFYCPEFLLHVLFGKRTLKFAKESISFKQKASIDLRLGTQEPDIQRE